MQVSEMNRVEGSSKDSDSGNFQPTLPPEHQSIKRQLPGARKGISDFGFRINADGR